ncbi:cytochrome b5 domain-containing protein [Caproiciproducens sp. MSJ-32]|uniref:cytochrome b5 domain-containing protein n=1 Tax=Caproiciproducens sp. MSJ-32 TaxID=2841527 RepID=UPI001C0FFE46|nr:cytochrome b5 domain-containing protein [Caproiciproducens sp. MSJ-32]MBU5454702.1 cytochrome b5 [Caproiciproducens sp. MSJ-32]
MGREDFLEKKFIELNELKARLITYPKDYRENIIETIKKVCNQIEIYLEKSTFERYHKISEFINLSREELKIYDGEEGRPAYIVVDGIVYDVTESEEWKYAKYLGARAGKDYTELFKKGKEECMPMLSNFKVIGVIKENMK